MRDRVRAIEKTVERQTVLHHWGIDQDVFGLYREGGFIEAIVLMVRGGKLTSTQGWSFQDLEFPDEEVLADLLTQYYSGARNIPDEVIVPVELEDADVRAELLSERRGKKVRSSSCRSAATSCACSKWRWRMRARALPRAATTRRRARRCSRICAPSSICATRPSGWNATTSRICRARWWSARR